MIVTVTIPPEPLVSWEEANAALNIDDESDQTYVEGLIAAASAWVDAGPDGWLGRSFGQQTLEARFRRFWGSEIVLPYGPVLTVTSILYLDVDGAEQPLDVAVYEFTSTNNIRLRDGHSWPSLADNPEAVRVTYEAGYLDIPAQVKQAILLLVGHWYRSRQAVVVGTISSELPLGFDALLSTLRRWQ